MPEVAEPFDQLSGVVLVELDVWKVDLEDGGTRIPDVKEHQLRLSKVHRRQSAGVRGQGSRTDKENNFTLNIKRHSPRNPLLNLETQCDIDEIMNTAEGYGRWIRSLNLINYFLFDLPF